MVKDFTTSLKKLFEQSDTGKNYLVFQKEGELFSAEMSPKYIKWRKRIFIFNLIFLYPTLDVLLNNDAPNQIIYIRTLYDFAMVGIILLASAIGKIVMDYFYCNRKFRKHYVTPYTDKTQNISGNYELVDGFFCTHKPSLKFKEILNFSWTKHESYICRHCGCNIEAPREEYKKAAYKIKNSILGAVGALILMELIIFISINLHKIFKYLLQTATECSDIMVLNDISFFNIFSGFLVAIIIYFMFCVYLYFQLNYFSKYKRTGTEKLQNLNADRSCV